MMKIKNKQFFNRKILMTLVVGTNVILGGTAVYAEEPQKFTLDEYVVTATRTELSRKEVPQSVEVITKEDIQNIGATNVIDALRTATNIEIPEAAGVGHTLGIRGSGKNDVLVLLNGRRIPGEGYGQVSTNTYVLSRLNVNNIERIEVLRGPSGALYGSEASAGVINIITKKSEKKSMTVGVATNSREMSNYYHFDSGKDGKLSAAFDANFTKVRYFKWDDANMSKYFGPTQNYSLDVDYEMDQNNSLNLYLNYENTNQQFKKFTSASGPFSYLGIYNVDRKSASLTYNGQNDNSNYMLSATYGELKKDVTSAMSANSVGSSKFNFWNIEARDTIKLDNNNRLTFGGEFRTDGRKDSSIDESSDQYSLFIHDELKLGEKLLLIPAVRYDHHDSFGSETSPNIGATYSFTEGSRLKANYGEGYRAPSISELYGTYSNPNLRPEKSKGYELSYEQEFGDDTAIKLTYFKNKKTDAIAMDYSLAPNYQYMNIEKSSSEGVEFEIKHDLGNGFTVIGNYDYLDAMNDKTNTRLNYSARNTYTAKLMWTEPVKQEWNITAWNKWYSDYRADSGDHSINTFNFVVNKRWGDKYRAYAGIDNLFDKKITSMRYSGRLWRVGAEMTF
ncbi:TonB-dependent receptor plug domain-containing protein [Phascolarctobacterium faecium]|jgi:outer membrane receptor for ferrienterochelin and colicins|uniref:TonB-dependent receptor plug domain-containing protein n=1 Tax=Phascolarctobacterium faecium TaxID=33025 RepID=UPI0039958684